MKTIPIIGRERFGRDGPNSLFRAKKER